MAANIKVTSEREPQEGGWKGLSAWRLISSPFRRGCLEAGVTHVVQTMPYSPAALEQFCGKDAVTTGEK